jgi:hypothetical protein
MTGSERKRGTGIEREINSEIGTDIVIEIGNETMTGIEADARGIGSEITIIREFRVKIDKRMTSNFDNSPSCSFCSLYKISSSSSSLRRIIWASWPTYWALELIL